MVIDNKTFSSVEALPYYHMPSFEIDKCFFKNAIITIKMSLTIVLFWGDNAPSYHINYANTRYLLRAHFYDLCLCQKRFLFTSFCYLSLYDR